MCMRTIRWSLPVLLLLCSASLAKADTVTFEGLSDGTVVTNELANLVFVNAVVASAGVSLNEFEFPPRSGSNIVFDNGGPLSISFLVPVTGVSGYFTYTTQITLTAFDSSNNVIGALTSAFNNNLALSGDPGSQPNEFLSFSMLLGVSRITISGAPEGGSFTLDDLTFETSVPEPGSIVLLLTGGGFYFRLLRRRRLRRESTKVNDLS